MQSSTLLPAALEIYNYLNTYAPCAAKSAWINKRTKINFHNSFRRLISAEKMQNILNVALKTICIFLAAKYISVVDMIQDIWHDMILFFGRSMTSSDFFFSCERMCSLWTINVCEKIHNNDSPQINPCVILDAVKWLVKMHKSIIWIWKVNYKKERKIENDAWQSPCVRR